MESTVNEKFSKVVFTNGLTKMKTKPIFFLLGYSDYKGVPELGLFLVSGHAVMQRNYFLDKRFDDNFKEVEKFFEHTYKFKCTDQEAFRFVRILTEMNESVFSSVYASGTCVVSPPQEFHDECLQFLCDWLFILLGDSFIFKYYQFPSTTIEIPLIITNDFEIID